VRSDDHDNAKSSLAKDDFAIMEKIKKFGDQYLALQFMEGEKEESAAAN
jgi:hypothetical protein